MIFSELELEKYADVLIWGLITARSKRFKKGDIVVCISNYTYKESLTIGKTYNVLDTNSISITIKNDKGEPVWFIMSRFKKQLDYNIDKYKL